MTATPNRRASDDRGGGTTRSTPADVIAAELAGIDSLSEWLDSRFRIPGTNVRFGADALAGVVPGVGDTAGLVASAYVIARAVRLGARGWTLTRMVSLATVDAVFGLVPVLGTVFDVVFKANQRNVELLRRHVIDPGAATVSARRSVVAVAVAVSMTMLFVVAGIAALVWWAASSI